MRKTPMIVMMAAALVAGATVLTMNAEEAEKKMQDAQESTQETPPEGQRYAMFGAGCFWCVEAVYERLDGVSDVVSGYSGGQWEKPTYKDVCSGDSGHAEVIRVTYDPTKVKYQALVDMFFKMHDPTQLNRQGADVGTQYRSAIFFYDAEQQKVAEETKKALDASSAHRKPIATEIVSAKTFYAAEAKHQDFYKNNPNIPYSWNIRLKLKKLGL